MSLRLADVVAVVASKLNFPKLGLGNFVFKDQLRIFMHPQQVVLVRIKYNDPGRIVCKKTIDCDPETNTAGDNTAWAAALNALTTTLQESCWQGANPQLVISNHFVRYALIPWHESLANPAERQAFLRHSFQLAYGDAARAWDLRMSDDGVDRNALASGVEQAFLQDVHLAFADAGFKLSVVYPHLMTANNTTVMNLQKRQIGYADYWFIVVETGRLCIAMIHEGRWISVKTSAIFEDVFIQVTAHVDRESVICGIDTADWPLVVYWPGHTAVIERSVSAREVVWIDFRETGLQKNSSAEAVDYGMVLWA